MIYKNAEFFGCAEIYSDGEGVSWLRVPSDVDEKLEGGNQSYRMCRGSTGVEIRFVMKSDEVKIKMQKFDPDDDSVTAFHVFHGGIQGSWDEHEKGKYVTSEPQEFVIKKAANLETLRKMAATYNDPWDPEVVRIIFDRGRYRVLGIEGDIEPPKPEQCPKKTLFCYGSSITHGSNALSASNNWVSVLARKLGMDARNLGFAGSCAMEPAIADYIASEGEQGKWDMAIMELGINVLGWDEEKIHERVRNIVTDVASRNPEKPIYVVSPFYCHADFNGNPAAKKWRDIMKVDVPALGFKNVTYIDGLDILNGAEYLSADEVHPNIYGVMEMTENFYKAINK